MHIKIKNVRTFAGYHSIEIFPVTFLIGENSTGKTTIMNAVSVVSSSRGFPFKPDFNQLPYEMGNFVNIATQKRGRNGNSKDFGIGYSKTYSKKHTSDVFAEYEDRNGIPYVSKLTISYRNSTLFLESNDKGYTVHPKINGETLGPVDFLDTETRVFQSPSVHEIALTVLRILALEGTEGKSTREEYTEKFRNLMKYFPMRAFDLRNTISLAPIRSKPKRTYDELREDFSPEGGHIPFLMSRIFNDDKMSHDFKSILENYGVDSGLFDSVRIRKLGSSSADPFQILVKKGSRESNIVDVGYGVSQILPILAECINAGDGKRILMQQPEVHLHPRAQAALGNLISTLYSQKQQHYVIETHSDYLIDRVRYEIMTGKINHEDVGIIYLEKDKSDTIVHSIKIDSNGNILNSPEGYRDFFVKEQFKLLGIEE